ncbi:MAG: gliding motility-associated C-terminal domain-containing protein, partial [Bacteroidetes bacterium]|nr:gliding motility-associated C-terminal domain-containing protein [Bacteroidota bacterium]
IVPCDTIPIFEGGIAYATDNLDSLPTLEFVDFYYSVDICDDGYRCQYEYVWTAYDECGNTSVFSFYVKPVDMVPPVLYLVPEDITIECSGAAGPPPPVFAIDNCDCCIGQVVVNYEENIYGNACNSTIVRTWSASDNCGNTVVETQTTTIHDETPPNIEGIPEDIVISCNDSLPPNPAVVITDYCTVEPHWTFNEIIGAEDTCGFEIHRIWTAVDECGNENSEVWVIKVQDLEGPSIQFSDSILSNLSSGATLVYECDEIPVFSETDAVVSDECLLLGQADDVSVEFFENITQGNCLEDGHVFKIEYCWIATDACGNSTDFCFNIQATDHTPPVFSNTPDNVTVGCSDIPDVPIITAFDACQTFGQEGANEVQLEFTQSVEQGDCSKIITRQWEATDDCGNVAIHTQVITAMDEAAPVVEFFFPPELTVDCSEELPAHAPSFTDDCQIAGLTGNQELSVTLLSDTILLDCGYRVERIWTATDECGNATSVPQNLNVIDSVEPELIGIPADLTIECTEMYPEPDSITAIDNCDENVEILFNEILGYSDCEYEIIRIWTALDECGNSVTEEQIITFIDTIAPVLVFANPLLEGLEDGDGVDIQCGETELFDETDAVAKDACSLNTQVIFEEEEIAQDECELSILNTWTAIDDCGNSTEISLAIHIIDTIPPELQNVPEDMTIQIGEDIPIAPTVTATDNCQYAGLTGEVEVVMNESQQPTDCGYILIRTWTATDACGNSSSASQQIHIEGIDDVLVEITPENCEQGDGAVSMTPANYNYLWSDGYDGATRTGLSAGIYEVTVSFDNCTDEITVIVPSDCECVEPVVSNVETEDAICGNSNGMAFISIEGDLADHSFVWLPDIGTSNTEGNMRSNLPTGEYSVLVIFMGIEECKKEVIFSIDNTIQPVETNIVEFIEADCETANGIVSISPSNYTYQWSDGGTGAYRIDLAADQYEVTVTGGGPDCTDILSIEMTEDCPQPCELFTESEITAMSSSLPADVCIEISLEEASLYDIILNDTQYVQPLDECATQMIVFYTYALLFGQGEQGPYNVDFWSVGDSLITDVVVDDMTELLELMNVNDPIGVWQLNADSYTLSGGDPLANYGNMVVTHIESGITATLQANFTEVALGTLIQVEYFGDHELILTDNAGCADTLIIHLLEQELPPDPEIITQEWVLINVNCDVGEVEFCVDIPLEEINQYGISINGDTYVSGFSACSFIGSLSYSSNTIPGLGEAGPYIIDSWTIDDEILGAGVFNNLDDLVATMNEWDPAGEWEMDLEGGSIVGGEDSREYGSLIIRQLNTSIIAILEPNRNILPNSTRLMLGVGNHEVIFTQLSNGVQDTVEVLVVCTTPEYIVDTIWLFELDTICLNVDELLGDSYTVSNVCEASGEDFVLFEAMPNSNCFTYFGQALGTDNACLVICDEMGVCDTTYLQVTVVSEEAPDPPIAVVDTVWTTENVPVSFNPLGNDYGSPFDSIQITSPPVIGEFIVNADGTLSYIPEEGYCNDHQPLLAAYAVFNAGGSDDALIFIYVMCDEVDFYTGFSPNGDGLNDCFQITGLQKYPYHQLKIFNRWGNQVYSSKNYQNDWKGDFEGKKLPDGTYFYLLDVGRKIFSGYMQLHK